MSIDPFETLGSGSRSRLTPTHSALIQGLEQIRERFHRHLDAIETLAREHSQHSGHHQPQREEQLQQRAVEIEHAQLQMQAKIDRWERERQTMLEKLEHDRRLLAEAWEQLEREQVKSVSSVPAAQRPAAAAVQSVVLPAPLALDTGRDQPVAEEILRQFQSLRRDVRRNAETSCSV